jgi:hypothetical protein
MKWALFGMAAMLLAAGCSSNIDTPEAVKQGVINDLSKRMDVKNMDVNVDSVSFRDHQADALVSFAPKGAPRSQGMTMRYKMERNGSEWHIASRASGDLQRHAQQAGAGQGQAELPAGHPAIGGEGAQGSSLPAGHPPIQPGETR